MEDNSGDGAAPIAASESFAEVFSNGLCLLVFVSNTTVGWTMGLLGVALGQEPQPVEAGDSGTVVQR
jgi:hypothetical protein